MSRIEDIHLTCTIGYANIDIYPPFFSYKYKLKDGLFVCKTHKNHDIDYQPINAIFVRCIDVSERFWLLLP